MQFDQLKRREFMTMLAGAVVTPLPVTAQEPNCLWRMDSSPGLGHSGSDWLNSRSPYDARSEIPFNRVIVLAGRDRNDRKLVIEACAA
jgi:hypothetical protein